MQRRRCWRADAQAFEGSKRILSLWPVAAAKRLSVRVDGMEDPLSRRAMAPCVVFMRLASSAWVRPAAARALMISDTSANSSSSASYSVKYLASRRQRAMASSTGMTFRGFFGDALLFVDALLMRSPRPAPRPAIAKQWRDHPFATAVGSSRQGLHRRRRPQDHRRLRGEHAAVAVGEGGLAIGDLARAALAAQLPHGLDQQEQAVHAGVAVGEAAAVGVDGEAALGPDPPALDEGAALALPAEAEVLQEQDRVDGEGVVELH